MVIRHKLVISMKRYEKCVINAKSPKGLLLAHLAPIYTWKQEAHPISPLLSLHRPGQSQPKAGPLQIQMVNSSKPCVAQGHPLQTTNFLSSSSPLLGRVRCVLVSSCSQIQIRLRKMLRLQNYSSSSPRNTMERIVICLMAPLNSNLAVFEFF